MPLPGVSSEGKVRRLIAGGALLALLRHSAILVPTFLPCRLQLCIVTDCKDIRAKDAGSRWNIKRGKEELIKQMSAWVVQFQFFVVMMFDFRLLRQSVAEW